MVLYIETTNNMKIKITLKVLCTYIVTSISIVTPTTMAIVLDNERGVKLINTNDVLSIEPIN